MLIVTIFVLISGWETSGIVREGNKVLCDIAPFTRFSPPPPQLRLPTYFLGQQNGFSLTFAD
jgi:hypothetical protein